MRCVSKALASAISVPVTRFTPAFATSWASASIAPPLPVMKRLESAGSPSPRSTMLPRSTPSAPSDPSRSTSVLNWWSAPNWSSASALVNSFMFDAGCSGSSGLTAYSVSLRVSESTTTPHVPLRTRACISWWRSLTSSSSLSGRSKCMADTARVSRRARLRGWCLVSSVGWRTEGARTARCAADASAGTSEHNNERQGYCRSDEKRRSAPRAEFQ